MNEKKEVIKHSAAVHIQNNITLLQRRAWNVLLAHAYDDLLTEEEHGIRTKDLMRMLEFDSKNEEYLRESLEALVSCKVRWNVLDKDHHWEWGVTTLLAHAIIKSGICTYSYSPPLRKRLYNPTLYARISLSLQNKFDSKHSLALWELCVDYLDESKRYGETPFIPLEKFKELLGLGDSTYVSEFKILNRDVIKPAVEEINKETDFQVTVGYHRRGRKVAAVQFRIRRVLQIPEPHARQATLFPELEDMPVIVTELQQSGLAKHDAWDIWQQGFLCVDPDKRPEHDDNSAFERYVREKIHLLKRQDHNKVKNRAGFLISAIKRNYANPYFAESEHARAAAQEARAAHLRAQQHRQAQQEKAQLEREHYERIHHICLQMLDETPALIEHVIEQVLADEPSYQQFYEPDKTLLQNYRQHAFLAAAVEMQVMQRYPERCAAIRTAYERQVTVLNRRIESLEC